MKKILFVLPPIFPFVELKGLDERKYPIFLHKTIPMGILSIASYLKENIEDIQIQILDLNLEVSKIISNNKMRDYESIEEVLNKIYSNKEIMDHPDYIGISSLFTPTYSYLISLSQYFKKIYDNPYIFAGGAAPTELYYKILKEIDTIDSVSLGEGEIPVYELLTCRNREDYIASKDCWVNRDKLAEKRKLMPYYMDLCKMCKIDYKLIELSEYQNSQRSSHNDSGITVSLMTSRGCPFKCCFCASHGVHGRKVRFIDENIIIEEMNTLIDEYKVSTFLIEDDHFFLKKERALRILGEMKNKDINIEFPNGIAVYAMDREIIAAMKNAGTKKVSLAIESGSSRILRDIIHKPLKLELVKPVIDMLREFDINIHGLFIIGFPGEKEEDRQKTIDFIKEMGFDSVSINIATPLVGSDLYKLCKEKNYLISEEVDHLYTAVGNIETEDFDPEYIEECRTLMNLELNYICNYDYVNKNYEKALEWFEYIIRRIPNHAFAYYYASKCYEYLGENKAEIYRGKFLQIIKEIPSWKEYAEKFCLLEE